MGSDFRGVQLYCVIMSSVREPQRPTTILYRMARALQFEKTVAARRQFRTRIAVLEVPYG